MRRVRQDRQEQVVEQRRVVFMRTTVAHGDAVVKWARVEFVLCGVARVRRYANVRV